MNTSIAPFSTIPAMPAMSSPPSPPASEAAAVVQSRPTTSTGSGASSAPSPTPSTSNGNLNKDITIDQSGIVVVKTIDSKSNEVLAQTPTEAYLRLAHAMTEAFQAETRSEPTSDVTA
ncbi:MAG: flagellar protein FlaG [Siculibacillus sp.]